MATDATRDKLVKLIDQVDQLEADYRDKRLLILAEIRSLLDGGEGIGPKVTRLKRHFAECWEGRYLSPYTFANHALVGAVLKRWLAAGLSEDEIGARMFAFLKSDERFYVQTRHGFEVFVKAFNALVPLPVIEDTADASASRAREMRGQ